MSKKIFIDCGYHLGEGMNEFTKKLNIDSTWDVYAFEANPKCEGQLKIDKHAFPINFFNAAVWDKDGTIRFSCENNTTSNSPLLNSTAANDGWGSCVANLGMDGRVVGEEVEVRSIDFGNFVNGLEGEIYCKMDIEGSEFKVLRKMITDGSIKKIKEIWIEWHDVNLEDENETTKQTIISQISDWTIYHEHH